MAESPKQRKITSFTSATPDRHDSSEAREERTPRKSNKKKSKKKNRTSSEAKTISEDEEITTSFTSATPDRHDSSEAREERTPPTKKKSKKKNRTSSESKAISEDEEITTHNDGGQINGDLNSTLSSPSAKSHWSFEEDGTLLQNVSEYLDQKECVEDAKKKHIFLKDIEWDQILEVGEHSSKEAHERFITLSNRGVRKLRTAKEILEDMKEHRKNPTSSKKKKVVVDDDAPKKPMSGFFQFNSEKRAKITKKYPNLSQPELTKKLSKRWRNMPPEKKQKYSDNYKANMLEYQHQMIEYLQTHHHPSTTPPRSGHELWTAHESQSIKSDRPDISDKKLNKKLKRRWENLEEEKKNEWFKKQKSELDNYRKRVKKSKMTEVESNELPYDELSFEMVPQGTQKEATKLIDNLGYTYVQGHRRWNVAYWTCSMNRDLRICKAIAIERDGSFRPGRNLHCHPPPPDSLLVTNVLKRIRLKAVKDPLKSARSIVKEVLKQENKSDALPRFLEMTRRVKLKRKRMQAKLMSA